MMTIQIQQTPDLDYNSSSRLLRYEEARQGVTSPIDPLTADDPPGECHERGICSSATEPP